MKRLGILLSGRGSNFEAIARNCAAGVLAAEIAIVISNKADARGLETARAMGLPAVAIPSKGWSREEHDRLVVSALNGAGVEVVCLAGYLRLVTPVLLGAFPGRVLNIHPSLLPSFPGLDAQRQALDHGVKITGCTVHYVTEEMDAGPILAQAAVPVLPGDTLDTLTERILREEHQLYTKGIQLVLEKM